MNFWAALGAILQILVPIVKQWLERNSEKKKEQQRGIDLVMEGIKNGDASQVTAGFSVLNKRVRG